MSSDAAGPVAQTIVQDFAAIGVPFLMRYSDQRRAHDWLRGIERHGGGTRVMIDGTAMRALAMSHLLADSRTPDIAAEQLQDLRRVRYPTD